METIQFDGMTFEQTNYVVKMPFKEIPEDVRKSNGYKDASNYVIFGWQEGDEAPMIIPCDAHSLTNMMYGRDGLTYLMKDGRFYIHQ